MYRSDVDCMYMHAHCCLRLLHDVCCHILPCCSPLSPSFSAFDPTRHHYNAAVASSGYMAAAYYGLYHSHSVPTPPPPDMQPIIDKTAAYVAKNGPSFEKTVLEKHVGDPRFDFLSPWSRYHSYYQAKVQEGRQRLSQGVPEVGGNTNDGGKPAEEKTASANLQRLSHGAVRFTIAPKPVRTVQPGVDLGEEEEEEEEDIPEAKRPRTEQEENGGDKMDCKIQVCTVILYSATLILLHCKCCSCVEPNTIIPFLYGSSLGTDSGLQVVTLKCF